MRSTFAFHFLCATVLAGCTRAVAVEACSPNPHDKWPVGKAVYLQSNEDLNSVISIPIGHDGKLYGGFVTATGGAGGSSIDGTTNLPAAPDALSSQGAVIVVDKVSAPSPSEGPSLGELRLMPLWFSTFSP